MHIRHDYSFAHAGSRATDTSAQVYPSACRLTLKWSQNKFFTFEQIKADPIDARQFLPQQCREVGQIGNSISFSLNQSSQLLTY